MATQLRAYWEKNKHLKIEERMRAILLAKESTQEQMREAAENLAELPGKKRIGTTVWSSGVESAPEGVPNPALALADPTAAEAILSAMERDLAAGDPRWKDDARMELYTRRKVETHYQSIEASWGAAVAGFKSAVALFRNAGLPSGDWLPYRYLLFPPAVAAARGPRRSTHGPPNAALNPSSTSAVVNVVYGGLNHHGSPGKSA